MIWLHETCLTYVELAPDGGGYYCINCNEFLLDDELVFGIDRMNGEPL